MRGMEGRVGVYQAEKLEESILGRRMNICKTQGEA